MGPKIYWWIIKNSKSVDIHKSDEWLFLKFKLRRPHIRIYSCLRYSWILNMTSNWRECFCIIFITKRIFWLSSRSLLTWGDKFVYSGGLWNNFIGSKFQCQLSLGLCVHHFWHIKFATVSCTGASGFSPREVVKFVFQVVVFAVQYVVSCFCQKNISTNLNSLMFGLNKTHCEHQFCNKFCTLSYEKFRNCFYENVVYVFLHKILGLL